jgi:GNAT superfamily N-acetyltransferase
MVWRLPRSQFERQKGAGNKRALKALATSGPPPGVLAYQDGRPVGWCAVAPRAEYQALARSRILAPLDDQPVWSVSCLFVERGFRRCGVSVKLLRAAVEYARKQGAKIVEGYPVEPQGKKSAPDVFVWTGLASSFRRAGFLEVARRSPTRPIMRRRLRRR